MAPQIISETIDKLFLLAAFILGGWTFRAGYWLGNQVSYFREHNTYPEKPGDPIASTGTVTDDKKKESDEDWENGL